MEKGPAPTLQRLDSFVDVRWHPDEEIHSQRARWPTRVAVYHLYERCDYGTYQSWMGLTDHPDLLPVSTSLRPPVLSERLCSRYFSLFTIYTPYTVYKCKSPQGNDDHQLTSPIPDGFSGWGKMVLRDGWKCG